MEHIEEFRSLLADYHLSESALQTLKQTRLVLLTGVTAAGRNTIINELLGTGEYHYIVSDTSRKPRVNDGVPERDGVEYWFRSESEVLEDIRAGNFLEAEVIHGQQVSGISIRELERAHQEHKIAITDVDIGGISNVMNLKPDTVALLILPPSFDEWVKRIRGRGDMPEEEYHRRLQTAVRIFEAGLQDENLKIVINAQLADTAAFVHHLVTSGEYTVEQRERGRQLLESLLLQTRAVLDV